MPAEASPYQVLGVGPEASLEDIRRAYRQAALRCHPDNCAGDPGEAVRRFHQVTAAYREACRRLPRAQRVVGRARFGHPLKAADFTRLNQAWALRGAGGRLFWQDLPIACKVSMATTDEPAVFVVCWLLAILLSVVAGWVLAASGLAGGAGGPVRPAGVALIVALPLVLYAVLLAVAAGALVLSRKVVWLMARLGRRALPAPGPAAPLNAPPPAGKLPPRS